MKRQHLRGHGLAAFPHEDLLVSAYLSQVAELRAFPLAALYAVAKARARPLALAVSPDGNRLLDTS